MFRIAAFFFLFCIRQYVSYTRFSSAEATLAKIEAAKIEANNGTPYIAVPVHCNAPNCSAQAPRHKLQTLHKSERKKKRQTKNASSGLACRCRHTQDYCLQDDSANFAQKRTQKKRQTKNASSGLACRCRHTQDYCLQDDSTKAMSLCAHACGPRLVRLVLEVLSFVECVVILVVVQFIL